MSFPEPLLDSRTVGRWRVHAIQAGGQQLDGGAMFGVVPKTLWERRISADAKNRIPMGMRCLLITASASCSALVSAMARLSARPMPSRLRRCGII